MRKIPFYIMKQNVQHGFWSEISSSRRKLKSGQRGFELKCAFFMWPRKSHHPVSADCVFYLCDLLSMLILQYQPCYRFIYTNSESVTAYMSHICILNFHGLFLWLSFLFSVKTLCSELGALHLYIYLCRFLYCCQFWGNNLTIQSYQRTCIMNVSYLGKF